MSESRAGQADLRSRRRQRIAGAVLLGLGALLLAVAGSYYAYGVVAESRLDRLVYSGDRPTFSEALSGSVSPPEERGAGSNASASKTDGPAERPNSGSAAKVEPLVVPAVDDDTRPRTEEAQVESSIRANESDGHEVGSVEAGSVQPASADEYGASDEPVAQDVASGEDAYESAALVVEEPRLGSSEVSASADEGRAEPESATLGGVEAPATTGGNVELLGTAIDSGPVLRQALDERKDGASESGDASRDGVVPPEVPADEAVSTEAKVNEDALAAANIWSDGVTGGDEALREKEAVAAIEGTASGNGESASPSSSVSPGPVEVSPPSGDPSKGEVTESTPAISLSPIEVSKIEAASYIAPIPIDYLGETSPAVRMRIPAIGVDSQIQDLKVVFLSDSLAWETPNRVVGHIPTTPRPGAPGEGWYFGHLESPVRGEGNVFRRLPEIPQLAETEPVYIFVDTERRSYLYRVYKTDVLPQEELQITDSGERDITLVACVPRFHYNHRLVVTAALVGLSESPFGLEGIPLGLSATSP